MFWRPANRRWGEIAASGLLQRLDPGGRPERPARRGGAAESPAAFFRHIQVEEPIQIADSELIAPVIPI